MEAQAGTEIQFNVDGRLIVARPRPEDEGVLAQLLGGDNSIKVHQPTTDTEGHTLAAGDVAVDVAGHAMVLRLPTTADADAIRRALAVAALTATVAIGSFTAGTWASRPTTAPVPPAAITAPAQAAPANVNADVGTADQAATISAEQFAQSRHTTAAPAQVAPAPEPGPAPQPFDRQGERPE